MTALATQQHIGLVVEGAGDLKALPLILRRHLENVGEYRDILGKPVPLHGRSKATAPNGLEGYVATAARPACVGVLVVLDADDDCIARLGQDLHRRANSIVNIPVLIALADRDFEDWIYASAETLEIGLTFDPSKPGKKMIPLGLAPASYTKPVHQPKLAARMDLDLAATRDRSFARLIQCFDRLRARLAD